MKDRFLFKWILKLIPTWFIIEALFFIIRIKIFNFSIKNNIVFSICINISVLILWSLLGNFIKQTRGDDE